MKDILIELCFLLDVLLAVVLGFAIGLERKLRFKEAGIRTHTIVAFGSALMMVISKHAFDTDVDSSRVAAQIVSGIGFIGAGMIIYKKRAVRGLTTAAGVWATAGIGMACGGQMYFVAVGATIILITVQWLCHTNLGVFRPNKCYSIKIKFYQRGESNLKIKQIFKVDKFNRLVIERVGEDVVYSASVYTAKEIASASLDEIMVSNPFIISLERCDDE